jgi:Rad3-related DNA helicase
MTVMGSREQLCIHEKISKLKSSVLNHACNSLNSKRSCMYRNNLDNYIESGSSMDSTALMDIEEMVKLGNHRKICPYFHSREFSTSSDLVLLPYNYLLDSTIRRTLKLDWSKCIVIFDEAHNLERVAADAASFSLSSTDLALCIQEMKQVLTKLKDDQDKAKAPSEAEALQKLNVPATAVSSGNVMGGILKPTLAMAVYLLKALFELERRIDGLQVPGSTGPVQQSGPAKDLNGLVYPGEWLGQLLLAVGLSTEQVRVLSGVFLLSSHVVTSFLCACRTWMTCAAAATC